MREFLKRLKRVKADDILQIWKLPIALVGSLFLRFTHKNLWIVSEDPYEARDNGYWFYKYVTENYPEQDCIYAIKKNSPDYRKVNDIGKTVEFGSLKHWCYYLTSKIQVSSQKAGSPNAAIFYFLEVYGLLKNKRLFLQHGVTKDDSKWLYYNVTKMRRFICGAYPEYKYIKDKFGYPEGNVCYTGFCRFDGLHNCNTDKRLILIMPTWREWIADEDFRLKEFEGTTNIQETEYFQTWISFLCDHELIKIAKNYNVYFVFYPHRNMQKYLSYLPESNEFVRIAGSKEYDVQDLLKKASLLITDYSSVFFDFIYMKKPVIFYQFDYQKFRFGQYKEGYFNYSDNPFGNRFTEKREVIQNIERNIRNKFNVDELFLKGHSEYFPLYDNLNTERVFKIAKELSDLC